LLHVNAAAHKATSVCQFLTQKMLQRFITPVLFRFIFTRLFCSPSWKWSLKGPTLRMLLRYKKP
jgi:hypothetical protein